MKSFYSNGKLLISGEYVVLESALALGLPTKLGQSLDISATSSSYFTWKSYDADGSIWFEAELNLDAEVKNTEFKELSTEQKLINILQQARRLNSAFLKNPKGLKVETRLDFPRNWGLGTSSTLINNISQWADIDAFKLLELSFGGSGYDIACAQNNTPIFYQLVDGVQNIKKAKFNPLFKHQLYFLYLGKKQDSRQGISEYFNHKGETDQEIKQISQISRAMVECNSFEEFKLLMDKHESIISSIVQRPRVKEHLFRDFKGSIKSLGAWGGDFVLIATDSEPSEYFKEKGYEVLLAYDQLILQ